MAPTKVFSWHKPDDPCGCAIGCRTGIVEPSSAESRLADTEKIEALLAQKRCVKVTFRDLVGGMPPQMFEAKGPKPIPDIHDGVPAPYECIIIPTEIMCPGFMGPTGRHGVAPAEQRRRAVAQRGGYCDICGNLTSVIGASSEHDTVAALGSVETVMEVSLCPMCMRALKISTIEPHPTRDGVDVVTFRCPIDGDIWRSVFVSRVEVGRYGENRDAVGTMM